MVVHFPLQIEPQLKLQAVPHTPEQESLHPDSHPIDSDLNTLSCAINFAGIHSVRAIPNNGKTHLDACLKNCLRDCRPLLLSFLSFIVVLLPWMLASKNVVV